jgi:hypothetical protein
MTILTTLLAAAATLTVATAASAAPNAELPVTKATPSRYAVTYDRKHDRYCVRDRAAAPITGSHLVPVQCKTSSDWAAEGLTIARKS